MGSQRVEQRIGRCHRYGQKTDVLVVNLLNRKNGAEARVYELLESKFQLFSGVFGASDEVLGVISGVDFEKSVLNIFSPLEPRRNSTGVRLSAGEPSGQDRQGPERREEQDLCEL